MQAVCFKCGGSKSDPLKLCRHCHALPESHNDRVTSMCLSQNCLKPANVVKAGKFIKQKKRPPGFRSKVKNRAIELINALPDESDSVSMSIDLSDSFFLLDKRDEPAIKKLVVHAIGKPANGAADTYHQHPSRTRKSTYHTLEWEIGRDISQHEADVHADSSGELFVWYRYLGNEWAWKCIPRHEFEQLREMETARTVARLDIHVR